MMKRGEKETAAGQTKIAGQAGRFAAAALLLVCLVGCNKSGNSSNDGPAKELPKQLTPKSVLKHLRETYLSAGTYRDRGVLRLRYREGQQVREDTAPLSVVFRRPGRINARLYQTQVVCDGRHLYARIQDEQTGDMDGQIVDREAPEKITLQEIYKDEMLRDIIGGGMGRFPVQLELLLAPQALTSLTADSTSMRLLPKASIGESSCLRLEIAVSRGAYVLWIDRESFLLRRFEFPAEEYLPQLTSAPGISNVKLTADFEQASFAEDIPSTEFVFDVPRGATRVQHFVRLPQPLPSSLFGKRPQEFYFHDLEGKKVAGDTLQGRIAVLLWFNNHPSGEATLRQLDAIARQYGDNEKLVFYAVCTEPSALDNDKLKDLLSQWKIESTVLRDLKPFGPSHFEIQALPTLIVLDAEGAVNVSDVLYQADLDKNLPVVLDQLLAGKNLAKKILDNYKAAQQQYQRQLTAASGAKSVTNIELPETKIAPPLAAEKLKLTRLWECDEFKAAGNLLVIEDDGEQPTIFAHDGYRTILQLDSQGKVVARHVLDLPEEAAVTRIRSAVDAQGKRFYAAFQWQGKQVHLFDETWSRLFSYPDAEQQHDGIHDVLLASLDTGVTAEEESTDEESKADAEDAKKTEAPLALYVGFGGSAGLGLHRVNLKGERQWTNRGVPTVLSLSHWSDPQSKQRLLLATGDGQVSAFNGAGKIVQSMQVRNQTVLQLLSGDGSNPIPFCGVVPAADNKLAVIGLDRNFTQQWAYDLPPGLHGSQIQYVAWGRLFDEDRAQWLIAGADGSIQITGQEEADSDYYRYGQALTGLATARFDSRRVLLTATKESVTAWLCEPIDAEKTSP